MGSQTFEVRCDHEALQFSLGSLMWPRVRWWSNKRLAGWERRRTEGSAGLEIGAWRDRTSVEFDKNATVSEARTPLFSRYFIQVARCRTKSSSPLSASQCRSTRIWRSARTARYRLLNFSAFSEPRVASPALYE